MLRVVGIVALLVLAACNQTSVKTGPSPSPVIAQGNWNENLTLSGDLPGRITTILPDTSSQQSLCSGSKARSGDLWTISMFTTVDSSGQVWELTVSINSFRGSGIYGPQDVSIALQNPENTKAWITEPKDTITLSIDRSQQSGTIDASLTDASSGKSASERVAGTWNCRG